MYNLLRRFWVLQILLIGFLAMSCSDDDDDGGVVNSQSIEGVWKLVHIEGYEEGEHWSEPYTRLERYYKFDSDGLVTDYTYDSEDDKYEIDILGRYTINVNENTLTIADDSKYDIITLSSKKLIIKSSWLYNQKEEYEIQTFEKVNESVLDKFLK